MTYSRFFSANPLMGITRIFHGEEDGGFTIETRQECDAILERNKALRNGQKSHGMLKFDPKAAFHQVASISHAHFYDLKRRGILGGDGCTILDEKAFIKWLHDRENSGFRTHDGTIS